MNFLQYLPVVIRTVLYLPERTSSCQRLRNITKSALIILKHSLVCTDLITTIHNPTLNYVAIAESKLSKLLKKIDQI